MFLVDNESIIPAKIVEARQYPRVNRIHSTLGKVNLCITFNDGEKQKSIPTEFIVVGSDWPDHFPDLTLGMP